LTFSGEEKIEEERREGRNEIRKDTENEREIGTKKRRTKDGKESTHHLLVCKLKSEPLEGGEKMRRNAGQRTAIRIIARD